MKKFYFLLTFLPFFGFSQVINEIDPDQSGNDAQEFVEISWTANTALDGLVIVFFNGSDDASYLSFDLDGQSTDANGYFVLGNAAVNNVDLVFTNNSLQNGADAVALYTGNDTDFPNDTPVTQVNLIDAIVYGTNDSDDDGLLTGLGETTQYNDTPSESIQLVSGDFINAAPTPGEDNSSETCDLIIGSISSSCDDITVGADTVSATVDFTGGGTSTYVVTADFGDVDLSGGDPSSDATGTISITNIPEGQAVVLNISDGGACDVDTNIFAVDCVPSNDLPINESFDYPDGSLVPNGGWTTHSGNAGDMLVASGQLEVQHGAPSEDAHIEFTEVSGSVYTSFDFVIADLGDPIGTGGTDFEYFAHFMRNEGNFVGRIDVVAPSNSGDYSIGIATNNSTAEATWATDLSYDVTYRLTVKFDQDNNQAQLWIDATSEADASISGVDEDGTQVVNQFAFRQSDSSENEKITVDNLTIAETFAETLSTNEVEFSTNTISLYPNPVNDGIVNITSPTNAALEVTAFDILGKQVLNTTVSNNRLDVSELKAGLYILRIADDSTVSTKKLLVK